MAMGFADAVGPFVSLAKNEFQLSNAVASLIPFVGFVMFGLLSIPMGVFQDKHGKKLVLMLGLSVALVGLLNAAFGLTSFARFLLTVLLVGAGAAILQVSGNPIMRDVSDPGKYARNLSLAQFVKAIGSLSGPMIPLVAAKYFGASWTVIFPIYAVALVVAAPSPDPAVLATLRERAAALPEPDLAAFTVLGDDELLVARWRGGSAERARTFIQDCWRILRPALLGRPAVAPRIWAT